MLISLKVLIAYLKKFDSPYVPMAEIKEVDLIKILFDCLEYENECLGEITHLSLQSLT